MHAAHVRQTARRYGEHRRGALTVLAALLLVVCLVFVALAVDVGFVCLARSEAQNAVDSAALAAARELITEERLRGNFEQSDDDARRVAAEYAALHRVGGSPGALDATDVVTGRLVSFSDHSVPLDQRDPASFNALTVKLAVTRGLFFAAVMGRTSFSAEATATAAFADQISGFRPEPGETTSLLPFTLDVETWSDYLGHSSGDAWSFDPDSKTVRPGNDGLQELKLYPLEHGDGNWGTVNIGTRTNSTSVLDRQIRKGINADDLRSRRDGLILDSATRSLLLNGDPGVSAGMKDALRSIIGQPRTIPLYRSAAGTGNQLDYEIVGFAGIRIVEVHLTSEERYVLVQPAYVIDPSAVAAPWAPQSYFVMRPVRLVR